MLGKFSPTGAILIFFLLTGLISCNERIPDDDGKKGGIPFDTVRAGRSVIPIEQAISFQKSFIATRNEIARKVTDTFLTSNFNLPNGEAFTKDALLLLLSQKDADGVRVYYGKDSKGVVRLVLLPVTKDGKVIYTKLIASSTPKPRTDTGSPKLRAADAAAADTDAEAVETGQTCPPCLIDPQQE